jgi:thiol-disulfide isomerase/thioredoxin
LGIVHKSKDSNAISKNISKFPSFSFITLKDTSFNSQIIKEGPVLIIKFHPECEHCKYEISEIVKSNLANSGVKVLLISSADRRSVSKYLNQFNISEISGIIPMLDTAFIFSNLFGKDIVPSNFIYNRKLELVKVLYGEYKIEAIMKYFKYCE